MKITMKQNELFIVVVIGLIKRIHGFGFVMDLNTTVDVIEFESVSFFCFSYYRFWPNVTRNGQAIQARDKLPYVVSLRSTGRCFSLDVFIPSSEMTEKEHNSKWICKYDVWYGEIISVLILNLQVPVRMVTIDKVMTMNKDLSIPFYVRCTVKRTRPAVNITWFLDDQQVNDTSSTQTVSKKTAYEMYTTISTLKLVKKDFHEYRYVHCKAVNIQGKPPVKSSQIVWSETICSQCYAIGWEVDRYAGTIGIANIFVIITVTIILYRHQRVQMNFECCKDKTSNDEDAERVEPRQLELISRRLEAGYEVNAVRSREGENLYQNSC